MADRGQPDRIRVVEDGVLVDQPLLVAADLDRWMEHPPDLLAHEHHRAGREDLHALFDAGYVTGTLSLELRVSRRIRLTR